MKENHTNSGKVGLSHVRQIFLACIADAKREGKRRNLEILWQVLEDIRESASRDYSLAEVGRRSNAAGGVKTQSLRNSQGQQFRELIRAYAAAVSGSARYVAKSRSQVDYALDMVTDPSVRVVLRTEIQQVKRLKEENDSLRAAFSRLSIGTIGQSESGNESDERPRETLTLSARYATALRKGVSRTRLAERGLIVQTDGSIKTDTGQTLFPPAFTLAIDFVLDNYEAPDASEGDKK